MWYQINWNIQGNHQRFYWLDGCRLCQGWAALMIFCSFLTTSMRRAGWKLQPSAFPGGWTTILASFLTSLTTHVMTVGENWPTYGSHLGWVTLLSHRAAGWAAALWTTPEMSTSLEVPAPGTPHQFNHESWGFSGISASTYFSNILDLKIHKNNTFLVEGTYYNIFHKTWRVYTERDIFI